MGFTKWIGAAVGWSFGGPIGAIVGMAVGATVDAVMGTKSQTSNRKYNRQTTQTQSGDFELSLLVLASVVIKADGKHDKRELDHVRHVFVQMYGKDRANKAFELFRNINKQEISIKQVSQQIRRMMDHASRLQLLHFLFGIANADGAVSAKEVDVIHTIANYLAINLRDFESIKAMFYDSTDSAYKILEINSEATNDEIKKAYRRMAKKYHPDKVSHLGEAHLKGAEDKFKQVQLAYDKLQKERGFN